MGRYQNSWRSILRVINIWGPMTRPWYFFPGREQQTLHPRAKAGNSPFAPVNADGPCPTILDAALSEINNSMFKAQRQMYGFSLFQFVFEILPESCRHWSGPHVRRNALPRPWPSKRWRCEADALLRQQLKSPQQWGPAPKRHHKPGLCRIDSTKTIQSPSFQIFRHHQAKL